MDVVWLPVEQLFPRSYFCSLTAVSHGLLSMTPNVHHVLHMVLVDEAITQAPAVNTAVVYSAGEGWLAQQTRPTRLLTCSITENQFQNQSYSSI